MSHERKLKSYAAEAAFYSHYCGCVLASGSAAAVAQPLLVDVRPPTHFLFVLSDLRVQFPERRYTLDTQVRPPLEMYTGACRFQQGAWVGLAV